MRDREREREAETQAEGEAGSLQGAPDVGLHPGTPGSHPEPRAGAKPPATRAFLALQFLFVNFYLLNE